MLCIDPANPATAPARALIERQLQVLTRLADIGMEIAEAAGRAATSPEPADSGVLQDPALAYSRAARAVRMTIALQSHLLKDLAALDKADGLLLSARAGARRNRLHRLVEQAVEAQREDEDEIEQLSSDAYERLSDWDDADIAGRSMAEVVAAICKDLGLSPEETAWAMSQVGDSAAEPSSTTGPGALSPDPPRAGLTLVGAASIRPGARSRAPPAPA